MRRRVLPILVILALIGSVFADPPPPLPPPGNIPAGDEPIVIDQLIPTLIDALKDSDPEVRQHLATALANAGDKAILPLIEVLKDPNRDKRAAAAYALAQIGPSARNALPALIKSLNDDDKFVRRQVAYAISRITTQDRPPVIFSPTPTYGPFPMKGMP